MCSGGGADHGPEASKAPRHRRRSPDAGRCLRTLRELRADFRGRNAAQGLRPLSELTQDFEERRQRGPQPRVYDRFRMLGFLRAMEPCLKREAAEAARLRTLPREEADTCTPAEEDKLGADGETPSALEQCPSTNASGPASEVGSDSEAEECTRRELEEGWREELSAWDLEYWQRETGDIADADLADAGKLEWEEALGSNGASGAAANSSYSHLLPYCLGCPEFEFEVGYWGVALGELHMYSGAAWSAAGEEVAAGAEP